MDYKLAIEKLGHPLLKPLLEELIPVFQKLEIKFFVIGATARAILMELHGEQPGRRTQDIDIAIAVDKWEHFDNLKQKVLQLSNFYKDSHQRQRFWYLKKFQLDIVPYGGITSGYDKIFWPPDQSIAMSVLGFVVAERNSITVKIDDLEIKVASLAGIFILKIVAWKGRNVSGNKDADDIGFILQNYLTVNEERAVTGYYEQIYEMDDYSIAKGGAVLLGSDIKLMLNDDKTVKVKLKNILEEEIQVREDSRLFNQIIETNPIKFDEIVDCFQLILQNLQ